MLIADPIRCDNWDRLLFGLTLFAGEDFNAIDYHPYRSEDDNNKPLSDADKKKAATERQIQLVKNHPHMTPEQKAAVLKKVEELHSGD